MVHSTVCRNRPYKKYFPISSGRKAHLPFLSNHQNCTLSPSHIPITGLNVHVLFFAIPSSGSQTRANQKTQREGNDSGQYGHDLAVAVCKPQMCSGLTQHHKKHSCFWLVLSSCHLLPSQDSPTNHSLRKTHTFEQNLSMGIPRESL